MRWYKPHHDEEAHFVFDDAPFAPLCKGGEGSGKSVSGVVKTLERLRRGMSGIMVSPDLPHFRRSLWDEFKRWCPPEALIEEHRYRLRFDWQPAQPFTLAFVTGATLICGGIEDPGSYEGPNVHFAYFDEARRHANANALKVLTGRARLVGPNGEPPQVFLTTTPRKHWLYDYYGPLKDPDDFASFKARSTVITLRTADNTPNLSETFLEDRRSSLTEAEAREVLDAEWEDQGSTRFLPSITLWDACQEPLPALTAYEPMVLALDGAVSGDTFAVVGITRHPTDDERFAVRHVGAYEPHGVALDFDAIQKDIEHLIENFNIVQVCYDPYQLHQMGQHLASRVWAEPFSQGVDRLIADRLLLDSIISRRISHDGHALLRQHLDNADRKIEGGEDGKKLRIVKRTQTARIDLSVATSMALYRAQEFQ
jgi:hypothetical protein